MDSSPGCPSGRTLMCKLTWLSVAEVTIRAYTGVSWVGFDFSPVFDKFFFPH